MRFDIVTLFPKIFEGYLKESLLHKAQQRGLIDVVLHDLRQWSTDKHHKVDDRPYGGGPGMVLKVEPVVSCIEDVRGQAEPAGSLILLSPQGRRLDQPLVRELAERQRLVLLCGRYEGFDQRVIDILQPEEISIGDYVLSGGEVAAMVVVDAVIRYIPGVLGDEQSSEDDSFSRSEGWLEFPQYTRPRQFRGHEVPEILLSGDHQAIEQWRRRQSYEQTRKRRADLLDRVAAPPNASDSPTDCQPTDCPDTD